jgi:hypothetical protein
MKQNDTNALRNLHDFLADTDGLTKQEVTEELRTTGVDVERFNVDVLSIVEAAHRNRASDVLEVTPGEVRTKSRDEILKLLEQIKAGVFGDDVADMLAARQQNAKELADEDVQALLQATLNRRQADKD